MSGYGQSFGVDFSVVFEHTPINPTMDPKTTPVDGAVQGTGGRTELAGKSLNAAIIKAMNPGDVLSDPGHHGLRVRCVGEQRVFYYRYKNPSGALRQVEIGVLGAMKLTEIRSKWQVLKDAVRSGADPRADLKAGRQKVEAATLAEKHPEKVQALTAGVVVERYLTEKVEKTRKTKGAMEATRLLNQLINFATWTAVQRTKGNAVGRRLSSWPKPVREGRGRERRRFRWWGLGRTQHPRQISP